MNPRIKNKILVYENGKGSNAAPQAKEYEISEHKLFARIEKLDISTDKSLLTLEFSTITKEQRKLVKSI